MAKYNGLIIPRSYNDYFSRSDPQAIKDIIATGTDATLNTESKNPIQNKAVAQLIPAAADVNNKLVISSEVAAIETDVNNIKNIIPTAASENNELADKNFVNSTVGTNTANYIYKTNVGGEKVPFNSIEELEAYSGTVTQNDYAVVTSTDENGNIYFDRYKADVNDDVVTWAKEYRLNNSSFTAEQWAAIQSGITSNLVNQIESVIGNTSLFVATTCDAAGSAEIKEITLDGVAIISGALIGVTFTNANINSTYDGSSNYVGTVVGYYEGLNDPSFYNNGNPKDDIDNLKSANLDDEEGSKQNHRAKKSAPHSDAEFDEFFSK